MSIANTKIYPKHLDGDVNKIIFSEFTLQKSYFDSIAKIATAPPGGHYTEAQLSSLGALREISEGHGVTFDTPVEGREITRYYKKYGLGFMITEEMISDDLQGNFKKMPKELGKSAALKRETVFWGDLFNNGFTGTNAINKAWDNLNIFVASGRTLLKETGTTQNNRPSPDASLSETSLEAALEYGINVKDTAGRPIGPFRPKYLVYPVALRATVKKLYNQEYNLSSMNRDINIVKDEGWKPLMVPHLTSSTAWFLVFEEHDFRFWWKFNFRTWSWDDPPTQNAMFAGSMRGVAFCNNPIGCYGTTG